MISDEELKNRKAFEAALAKAGSLLSTAWDMDADEYVYEDAEQVYRGWLLAHESITTEPSADVVERVPDYLKIAEGLQELSQLMLDQRGVKRTEKAEELWKSMRGEELAVYSAFLAKTCAPIIEAEVERRVREYRELIKSVLDDHDEWGNLPPSIETRLREAMAK